MPNPLSTSFAQEAIDTAAVKNATDAGVPKDKLQEVVDKVNAGENIKDVIAAVKSNDKILWMPKPLFYVSAGIVGAAVIYFAVKGFTK